MGNEIGSAPYWRERYYKEAELNRCNSKYLERLSRIVEEQKAEIVKYKTFYADELQKRLELAAIVEAMENGKDN